jgi:ketosteroid isomerase-like protein
MTRLTTLAVAALAAVVVGAQDDSLASLVAAERAFARMSVEKGRVAAFLANFAEDGIGFQPAPVRMKELLGRAPAASGSGPVLDWEPWTGDVAASGDLGYTTGPFERRPVDPAGKGQVLHGWFFTVWKRAGGGPWRVVADIGISSPAVDALRPHGFERALGETVLPGRGPYEARGGIRAPGRDRDEAPEALRAAEQELSRQATDGPAASAYRAWAWDRIRLYRDGLAPIVGREAAAVRVEGEAAHGSWQPLHVEVSRLGDLGYTYGSYQVETARSDGKKQSGYYLRVWARTPAGWRIVAEVTNAAPDKQ